MTIPVIAELKACMITIIDYDGDNPYAYFYEPTPPPQVLDEGTGLFGVLGTLVKDLGKLVGDLGR